MPCWRVCSVKTHVGGFGNLCEFRGSGAGVSHLVSPQVKVALFVLVLRLLEILGWYRYWNHPSYSPSLWHDGTVERGVDHKLQVGMAKLAKAVQVIGSYAIRSKGPNFLLLLTASRIMSMLTAL